MSEKQIGIEAQRQAYLESLYTQALCGNIDACEELSKIALGGFKFAQELVQKMDERLSLKTDLNIPSTKIEIQTWKERLFCLTHPKAAVEAKLRQIETSIEATDPPADSTFEEFPELPVSQAAALIHKARQKEKSREPDQRGGVQLDDWSRADQERMLKGEHPKGYPIHRNL